MEVFAKALGFDAVADAVEAEQAGFGGVRVVDHYWAPPPEGPSVPWPHPLVTLGAVAQATRTVTLTQTMMCVPFRHPAELAWGIATLDRISGGRAELGLGAGWFQPEHDAFGYRLGPARERVERLLEAVTICRTMLGNAGIVDFEGAHFRARNDVPWPATPHVPPVMVGVSRPVLAAGAARAADVLDLIHVIEQGRPLLDDAHLNDVARLRGLHDVALEAAAEAVNHVTFTATVFAVITDDAEQARQARQLLADRAQAPVSRLDDELLYVVGDQRHFLAVARTLADLGVTRIHLATPPPGSARTYAAVKELLPELHAVPAP